MFFLHCHNLFGAMMSLILLLAPLSACRSRTFAPMKAVVAGKVVDEKTDTPVSEARVLVVLYEDGYMTDQRLFYGVVSDAEGRFSVNIDIPFKVLNINVEAMSPDNQYGIAAFKEYGVAEFKDEPLTVRVGDIPADLKSRDYVNYEHFTGKHRWGFSSDKIIFPDESWEIRTDRQSGYPNPVIKGVEELKDE